MKIYSDVTTTTHKVSLSSKWVVSLPWWLLNEMQDHTVANCPSTLRQFWTVAWSHTEHGLMRSSFSGRQRDDESLDQTKNVWVMHLCDLTFLFPFLSRDLQYLLISQFKSNEQQQWQSQFVSGDLRWSVLEKADTEALKSFKDSWLGTPICHRLGFHWRSLATWNVAIDLVPDKRRNPTGNVNNLRFERRLANDQQRWPEFQQWLGNVRTDDQ